MTAVEPATEKRQHRAGTGLTTHVNPRAILERLPMEPLLAASPCRSWGELSIELGRQPNYARHQKLRGLTWKQCDEFAVALGMLPTEVWPEWEMLANRQAATKYCPLLALGRKLRKKVAA